jgi:hypothetical protein
MHEMAQKLVSTPLFCFQDLKLSTRDIIAGLKDTLNTIVYFGHKILPNGNMAHWAKVVAILKMPNPIDVHTLRSFIGLCNYYMIYVQDFNTIAHLLFALLKKDVAWTWSEETQEAFDTPKEKLLEFPILKRLDFNKVFILHTD